MAKKTAIAKIQMRNDTAENWESVNPVLDVGEIGYDVTNKKTKIGDGVTPWVDLDWFATETKPSFADNSWAQIAAFAENGKAASVYNVGDEKVIELTTGEQITLVILGFNHDSKTDGSKAAITFGMQGIVDGWYEMNGRGNDGSVVNGWCNSKMRDVYMRRLFRLLPTDLQKAITPVEKMTSAGGGSTELHKSIDDLFLLSLAEIYSHSAIETSNFNAIQRHAATYNAEGKQYAYWRDAIGDLDPDDSSDELVKRRCGYADYWWLRSPCVDYGIGAWFVDGDGYAYYDYVVYDYGVSFGFCI